MPRPSPFTDVDPARRALMARVRREHTAPELTVRRALHRQGLRFRLHAAGLPGRPDVVLPGRRVAVFVHGCFWHGHDCGGGRVPKTRTVYWQTKFAANRARDQRAEAALVALGWRVLVVWECETRDPARLAAFVGAVVATPRVGARKNKGGSGCLAVIGKGQTGC